jgi:hypothetical protein
MYRIVLAISAVLLVVCALQFATHQPSSNSPDKQATGSIPQSKDDPTRPEEVSAADLGSTDVSWRSWPSLTDF